MLSVRSSFGGQVVSSSGQIVSSSGQVVSADRLPLGKRTERG
ncbi:hypothetical protein AB0H28_17300 [Micromonospora sp. NPDC050980]